MNDKYINTSALFALSFPNDNSFFNIERKRTENPNSMPRCHYHSAYEIYYLSEGERIYFIQDKTYHIKKGSFVLIPPNVIHATFHTGSGAVERILVSFQKKYIADALPVFEGINFFECFENNIYVIPLNPQDQIECENILENMLKSFSDNNGAINSQLKLQLLQLLSQINNHPMVMEEKSAKNLTSTQKTMSNVMGYINNNFKQDISLEKIAEKFFLSPCYLSRAFKKSIGISFIDYVNNVRIMEAKKLLMQSNESIISVSQIVGFNSNTHFGRVFKKITGVSPFQFRKIKNND